MNNSTESAIDLVQVSHGYSSSLDVLKGISISIHSSSITVILGKSGSGKSTLMQIINGMIKPREGQVSLHGELMDYSRIHELRLGIGYVVQHIGLFPHMTIEANLALLGKISKKPKKEIHDRIKKLMELVQLPMAYLEKYPHELSGGEQQRAGLCRAMLLRPSILLMDEPFASLDHSTKLGIYSHLLDIQKKEQRTVVIITHDWEEANALADYYIWIENGKVKSTGERSSLKNLKDVYFTNLE